MKKIFVVLTLLAFVGAAAFAQDAKPTFGLWGKNQLMLAAGATGTGASQNIVQYWGPNWWNSGSAGGTDFEFTLDYQGAVMGYHVDWQMDNWNLFNSSNAITNAYVSIKAVPDTLTLKFGKMRDGTYRVDGGVLDDDPGFRIGRFDTDQSNLRSSGGSTYSKVAGAEVIVAPKGTNFSASLLLPIAMDAGTSDAVSASTIQGSLMQASYAFSYSVPSMVKITAGSTPSYNPVGGTVAWVLSSLGSGAGRAAFAGIDYTGVKGLDLNLVGQYVTSNEYTDATKKTSIQAALGVTYTMDAIGLNLAAYTNMPSDTTGGLGTWFDVIVTPTYNAGVVALACKVEYEGSQSSASGAKMESAIRVYPNVTYVPLNVNVGVNYFTQTTGTVTSVTSGNWQIPLTWYISF